MAVEAEKPRAISLRNIKLAIAFAGLNILDIILTQVIISTGKGYEVNPIMRLILYKPDWVVSIVKIGGIAVCIALFMSLVGKFPELQRTFTAIVVMMLAICLFNAIVLLRILL